MYTTIDDDVLTEIQEKVLEGGTIIKIKDNRTFHALFNNQNKKALIWFMSKILNKPMKDIKDVYQIENAELKPLNRYDKNKTVDFIVSIGDDVIIVEMNNNNSGRNYTRNLLYTFHALLNKVEIGGKYTGKRHGILVNLNWFTEGNKSFKDTVGIKEINYPYPIIGEEETDSIVKVLNVNLSFYDKKMYNGVNEKDFVWKLFTIDKVEEIHEIGKNVKELSDYCKELERLSESKEYCMLVWNERIEKNLEGLTFYEDGMKDGQKLGQEIGQKLGQEIGQKLGQEIGQKAGEEIGEIRKAKEIVLNMHHDNVSLDMIAKYVNLSKDEVQKIINSNN